MKTITHLVILACFFSLAAAAYAERPGFGAGEQNPGRNKNNVGINRIGPQSDDAEIFEEKDQADAQISGATEQAVNQDLEQTEQVADSLRQSEQSVASDMQQMVGSTKV